MSTPAEWESLLSTDALESLSRAGDLTVGLAGRVVTVTWEGSGGEGSATMALTASVGLGWRLARDPVLDFLVERCLVEPVTPCGMTPAQRLAWVADRWRFFRRPGWPWNLEEHLSAVLAEVRLHPLLGVARTTVGYRVPDVRSLAWVEFLHAVRENLLVRYCSTCGHPFVRVTNAVHCEWCARGSARQQRYYRRKKRGMTEEDKARQRAYWREAQRRHRQKAAGKFSR